MKKTFVVAVAAAIGITGVAPLTPAAAETATRPASLDQIRAEALAAMHAGELETVAKRGKRFRGNRFRGRSYRGGRGWRGRSGYRRGYYGGRRYHYRRGYRRDRGAAIAAGVIGLAAGAAIANSARSAPAYRSKRWCANRYRSYDWRSGTYVGYDGVRRACP